MVLWVANSAHNQKVEGLNPESSNILDGNVSEPCQVNIPAPNYNSTIKKINKNTDSTMGNKKEYKFLREKIWIHDKVFFF